MVRCDSPILVTGCARSGTSLVAGIVNLCGAWGGDMVGPHEYNKRGQFENLVVREKVVKPYLRVLGLDPRCQDPLPDTRLLPIVQDWHELFMYVMVQQGYKSGPLFYKGAKMCLMWPVWQAAFPRAKWVIVRRDDKGIINSCKRTPFMNTFSDDEGWQGWVDHHKECFDEMYNASLDIYEIWVPALVQGDLSEAEEMIEWLGLEWNEEAVKEFISPELWNSA